MAIDLEETYARYGPMVLRRCRRLLKDEEQSLDAMHDVFVQLLRRKETLDTQKPAQLLMRVATNVCLNRLRTLRRRPEDLEEDLLLRIASSDEGAERLTLSRLLLGRIFAREQPSTRAIAVMHLVDGMTLEEVSYEVNMSVSGIRKRLRTLKEHVSELEGV